MSWMSETDWNAVSAIATAIAAFCAFLACRQTSLSMRRTEQAARTQRLSDLWPDMQKLICLGAEQIENLNAHNNEDKEMELAGELQDKLNRWERIAYWWDVKLIDREALEDEIGADFKKFYEQVISLRAIRGLNGRSGEQLMEKYRHAKALYECLNSQNTKIISGKNLFHSPAADT
jgi:hypothetical protein